MRPFLTGVFVAMMGLLLLGPLARADEEKVPLDKLPQAVLDAVKAKFPGAKLTKASKEKEDGQLVYEVALKHKGHNHDVTLKEDGTIIEDEKEIDARDLPAAVKEGLESKYPKAEIKKAEEVTKGDKVEFEVLIVTAEKKKFEVVLDREGKVLKVEGKDKDKDEDRD
jgi:uncharacterized membrane protein YkoI